MPMLSLFVSLALSGPTALTATVNDPQSHGTLGDPLLSLDEAIRLANGTLSIAQLSAAEQAQLSGTTGDVREIVIDASITPTITLQAPLTPIVGPNNHTEHVEITGIAAANAPVLQGGNHPYVLALRRHLVHVEGLHILGGQVAIDAQMGPMGPHFHMAKVHECEIEGQSVAGVLVHGLGTEESMLMLEHVHFEGMPVGIRLDDQTSGTGTAMVECEFVHMHDVQLGNDVLGHGSGQMTMLNWFRSDFHGGDTLARLRRNPTATGDFMFRFVHCEADCHMDVLDAQGNGAGLTMVHHHHSNFTAAPGHKAFWAYPRTALFDIHGSEMHFDGDVSIAGNTFSPRMWQQNSHYANGTVTFDVDGALPNLLWNRYTNCTLVVPSTARSPVTVRSSELFATSVQGLSLFAPVALRGCYRNGGSLSGQASEQLPAPARFLGTTDTGPVEMPIGGIARLGADLPFGIGGYWVFAFSYPRPVTTAEPVRFYGDPATGILLPGMVVFQSNTQVPLPYSPGLVGLEFYVQSVTVPLLGQSYAPAYHLPRGGLLRFTW